MVNHFAVMGNPVEHSLSPFIHQCFAKQLGLKLHYEKILIDPQRFERQIIQFFQYGGVGLNITSPGKERAFLLSEKTSNRALEAKSANTLWMEDGRLNADNTDGIGLVRDLARYMKLENKTILILGAGGAARGIIGPLLTNHPQSISIANRTFAKALSLKNDFNAVNLVQLNEMTADFDLIINATSANNNEFLLPAEILKNKPFCYDLAYHQTGKTKFVNWALLNRCTATDGFGMLVEQAAEAFYIWHKIKPDVVPVLQQLRIY